MTPDVVTVVPVHDEAASIAGVVGRLAAHGPVVVVDDGSTDGSGALAARAGARVLVHPRRAGKGAALRTGFAQALRSGAVSVATLDGDGQHDPSELPRLLAVGRASPRALVLGDRLGDPAGDPVPALRLCGIRAADRALRWLLGVPLRDSQCGFRLYPAAFLRAAGLSEDGFVLETEALVRAVQTGYDLVSVPVRRIYHPGRVSRFRALGDAARIARFLAREALSSGRAASARVPGTAAPGRAQ